MKSEKLERPGENQLALDYRFHAENAERCIEPVEMPQRKVLITSRKGRRDAEFRRGQQQKWVKKNKKISASQRSQREEKKE